MAKARAIVTDLGSATGHMAALAREFGVPALVDTRQATRALAPGQVVTVDASSGRVYAGEAPELQAPGERSRLVGGRPDLMRRTPVFQLLESVAELLIPLSLGHPRLPSFSPERCFTLHDIARYAHEKSYDEMFHLGGRLGDMHEAGVRLDVFLPIDLFIFDLGGGIQASPGSRRVKPAQVTSAPLAALLKGMLDRRIPRFGAKPMDLRGLLGIMMRHALESPEQARTFRDPCYALVSDRYLNYTARVGYHFSVVDTYCGLTPNKNYVSALFRGGAADYSRRVRRVRAIAEVLKHHGFAVSVEDDAVHARLSKRNQEETAAHLAMIGRVFQFFRQTDATMISEESVQIILKAFLEENYDLSRLGRDRPTGG
jgi:pyruvate,water dikinase